MPSKRKTAKMYFESEEARRNVVEEQGFTYVGYDITEHNNVSLKYICKKGHYMERSIPNFFKARRPKNTKYSLCTICDGMWYTPESIEEEVGAMGLKVVDMSTHKDKWGNTYVGNSDYHTMVCNEGHKIRRSMADLKKGYGCGICSDDIKGSNFSRSEELIKKVLTRNNIEFEHSTFIEYEGEKLEMDFYLPQLGIYIEADGVHHVGTGKHRKDKFESVQNRDLLRDKYCTENGIELHRISNHYRGKYLIRKVSMILDDYGIHIDWKDIYYDKVIEELTAMVKERFPTAKTYEETVRLANAYKYHPDREIREELGLTPSVCRKCFFYLHGCGIQEYLQAEDGYEAGAIRKQMNATYGKNW